jgi:hypothetical protein
MGINRSFNPEAINQGRVLVRNDQYVDDNADDEYEEGEVSGYMMQKPITNSNTHNPNVCDVV